MFSAAFDELGGRSGAPTEGLRSRSLSAAYVLRPVRTASVSGGISYLLVPFAAMLALALRERSVSKRAGSNSWASL